MTILGVSSRAYKLAATCLFILSSVILCMSCYDYANALSDDNLSKVSSKNILLGNQLPQQTNLTAGIAEQKQILQFMVWPNQRLKAQAALENLLQRQVEFSPYDNAGLLPLMSLQAEINSSIDEKLWTLQRGIKLYQWRANLRPMLARHCILYRSSIQPPLKQECDHVIAQLPWQSRVSYLARLLGVDQLTLEQALARARQAK